MKTTRYIKITVGNDDEAIHSFIDNLAMEYAAHIQAEHLPRGVHARMEPGGAVSFKEAIAAHGDLRQALFEVMNKVLRERHLKMNVGSSQFLERIAKDCAEAVADFIEPSPADTEDREAALAHSILAKMLGQSNTDKYVALGGGKLDLTISRLVLTAQEDMLVSRLMKR